MSESDREIRLLYVVTEDQYFYSHRLPLARRAREHGCRVFLAARRVEHHGLLEAEDITLIPLRMQRSGKNPLWELYTLLQLYRVYRRIKPDLVHHVAMKPVLYGTAMALLARVPAVVNAIAGLGFVFISESALARFLRPLFGRAFPFLLNRGRVITIMQNDEDREIFRELGVDVDRRVTMVRGSGVDIDRFSPRPEPNGPITITLVARLLRHKGVEELIGAARILTAQGQNIRVVLVGDPDPLNPATCTETELRSWSAEGIIEWWGHRPDIPEVWHQSHIAVLPSYREGLPKSLLEAAACGRPMVATDVPGCRDVVRPGENGLLVPARNTEQLAAALQQLIDDPALRARMGAAARQMVENEYSDSMIAEQTMDVYGSLLGQRWPQRFSAQPKQERDA